MQHLIVVRDRVGFSGHYAADKTLPEVRARFKRLSGKFPTKNATILLALGEPCEQYSVDDMGTIAWPKGVEVIRLQN